MEESISFQEDSHAAEEKLAQEMLSRGADFLRKEEILKAERQFLLALEIYDRLEKRTGMKSYLGQAREICEILADLSMQQGNMHGADRYYVMAMDYGSREKEI